jgi:hypothetical protein
MPELSLLTALTWFGILASSASVAGLVFGLVGSRQTKRLQVDIHAATQLTIGDLAKGFRESQQSLGQMLHESQQSLGQMLHESQQSLGQILHENRQSLGQILHENQQSLGQILERMDQRADERQREVIKAIQALRG